MDLAAAGLREQPFRTHGKPVATTTYASFQEGLDALRDTFESRHGVALIQGPPLSGKTTLLQHFIDTVPQDCASAIVDGLGMGTTDLLESLLRQFGYLADFNSTGELQAMTRVFALQQASSSQSPLVIIENADRLNEDALRALSELAEVQVKQCSAIKLVLASSQSLKPVVASSILADLESRVVADIHLRPMRSEEATDFLHNKLRTAGSEIPEFVFPTSVCQELWEASGGWPGILDRVALLALANAETLPVSVSSVERPLLPEGTWNAEAIEAAEANMGIEPEAPMLYVSQHGKLLQRISFDKPRLLIGRSDHNDLTINSRFVSRHHLMLVRNGSTTFIMDLNSTNGTYLNSKRVSNHVLIDSDVITVGHHLIKFVDPGAKKRGELVGDEFADTTIMKTLEDMRSLLARENTAVIQVPSEHVPTLGGK